MIKVTLNEIVAARGLSLEKVAADTGIERGTLAKLAAGRTSVGLHTMDVLCGYLQIEPGDLLKRVADGEEAENAGSER